VARWSLLFQKAEYITGVNAIIHVASPLPNTADPQVILDVRSADTRSSFLYFLIFQKTIPFRALSPVPPAFSMLLLPLV
jgi:hypothetical protein